MHISWSWIIRMCKSSDREDIIPEKRGKNNAIGKSSCIENVSEWRFAGNQVLKMIMVFSFASSAGEISRNEKDFHLRHKNRPRQLFQKRERFLDFPHRRIQGRHPREVMPRAGWKQASRRSKDYKPSLRLFLLCSEEQQKKSSPLEIELSENFFRLSLTSRWRVRKFISEGYFYCVCECKTSHVSAQRCVFK